MRLDDLAVGVLQEVGAIAVQHAGTAGAERRRVLPVAMPSPAASTPISRTPACGMYGWKMPIALEPPPTQAMIASGCRPANSGICATHSRPITLWKSRTIIGYGCGPATVPMM